MLHQLTLLIFAIGGYFIVRYTIERKPLPKAKNGVSELYPEKREEK